MKWWQEEREEQYRASRALGQWLIVLLLAAALTGLVVWGVTR